MLDIDNFKMYNEQFTYEGGDNVLQELARFLVSHCRSTSDIVCRLGGDEFVIILPENNIEDAAKKSEDLLDRVKSLHIDFDSQSTNINITLSIGIAGFPEHGLTVKSLLKTASKALLKAKREGRERISLP